MRVKTRKQKCKPVERYCDNIVTAPANIWFKLHLEDLLILTENTNELIFQSHCDYMC